MSNSVSGEEQEATELLDETQRLRHKRDLLTKENEQLKSYLRLRQMESTATCEQLKSEIEQQIEQFEALGDQSFNDSQTTHLETLKSFRSEIEAIQCWNAKIRSKYFSRTSADGSRQTIANQITDELIDQMVSATVAAASGRAINDSNNTCDNGSDDVLDANRFDDLNAEQPKQKKSINRKTNPKSKIISSDASVKELDNKTNIRITRSKQKTINASLDKKRKTVDSNEDKKTASNTSKRKRN